jgi:hypothetical protein
MSPSGTDSTWNKESMQQQAKVKQYHERQRQFLGKKELLNSNSGDCVCSLYACWCLKRQLLALPIAYYNVKAATAV